MTRLMLILLAFLSFADKRGAGSASERLLKQALLDAKGLPADVVANHERSDSLAAIASAQADVGDVQGAASTLEELERPVNGVVPFPSPIRKSCVLISISKAQAKLGRVDEARAFARQASEILQQMSGERKSYSLSRLASARIAAGDVREGRAIRQDALKVAAKLESRDQNRGIRATAAIALDQANDGDVSGAMALIESQLRGKSPYGAVEADRTLAKIAATKAEAGDFDDALLACRKIIYPPGRADSLLEIARWRERRGEGREGDQLIATARRIYEDDTGIVRFVGLLGVHAALIQRGDLKGAKELITGVERSVEKMAPALQARCTAILASSAAERGEFDLAERRLAEAARLADEIEDAKIKEHLKDQLDASRSFVLLYSGGDLPPDERRSERILSLARKKALDEARRGDLEAALKTAAMFQDLPRRRAEGVEEVYEALAKAGQAEGATAAAEKLTLPLAKVRALIGIARGLNNPIPRPGP